ncbi:hypothetical protein [Bacillus sp. NPDC077027]|uniref:hypothetical protein n=1 Tax=Bacillus sp. NPDC077027 TaxID=3390548 RepID=UPI003CFEF569
MLGGIYWPLDIVPQFMQNISKVIPQTLIMSGFEEIMNGLTNHSVLLVNSMMLLIFTIIFLMIGLKNIKFS